MNPAVRRFLRRSVIALNVPMLFLLCGGLLVLVVGSWTS